MSSSFSFKTIQEIKQATAGSNSLPAVIATQVEKLLLKETSAGKPFYELLLRDQSGTLTLRAWSDKPAFLFCQETQEGDFIKIEGTFHQQGSFGLDAPGWQAATLNAEEKELLLWGTPEEQSQELARYEELCKILETLQEPRLKELVHQFLAQYEFRFRRAAAARLHHHAWRGGLLKHTLAMIQIADLVSTIYPQLHRDLLITGVLFHDSGKLWETGIADDALTIKQQLPGELLGHITIGIELVNTLWKQIPTEKMEAWKNLTPSSEEVRLHLLHLVASHHGSLEFGSPTLPKTPEAAALHFIDNLDAKLEMFQEAYKTLSPVTSHILERSYPLGVYPVMPLTQHAE